MFGNADDQRCNLNGTPTKRRKIDESIYNDDEIDLGLTLTRKKSLIQNFHFIGAINRKDSHKLSMLRKQSINRVPVSLGEFNQFELEDKKQSKQAYKKYHMDIQHQQSDDSSISEEKIQPKNLRLMKRVTMINTPNIDMIPGLFRCNSGIDIQQSIIETDERKYGDNIYLQQLERKNTAKQKQKQNVSKFSNIASSQNFKNNYNRKTYQQNSDDEMQKNIQERLLKDYQISSNFNAYVKNHENYICMNKLQRIFYYIKKINFSDQYDEDQVFQLCQNQIKLYNKDDQGHLLRFYQSWQQQDCVYLVFQTASTSLQQKLQSKIKLREKQVWSLLTDCCAALTWIKKSNEIHLNIKPGNILKCRQKYKLADPFVTFDTLSKVLSMFKNDQHEQRKLKLAFSYAAPELLQFHNFVQGLDFDKCDIFSLGISLLQNMTGMPINILKRDLKTIRKNNEKYLRGYSHSLRSLIIRMIALDPKKRPTSQQIGCLRELQLFQFSSKNNQIDQKCSPKKISRKFSL